MTPILILAVYPAALLIAAANDLYEFKIPNWISVTLLVAYLLGGVVLGASPAMVFEGLLIGADHRLYPVRNQNIRGRRRQASGCDLALDRRRRDHDVSG